MRIRKQADDVVPDFEGIVAGAGVALAQFDDAGRHTFANDRYCQLMGLPAAEIGGRSFDEIVSVTPAADEAALKEAVRGGSFVAALGTLSPRHAAPFPAAYEVAAIIRDGARRGAVCTIIDLSEHAKIKQAENREIAHRVRNIFAIAQALVGQTLRAIAAPREIIHVINQRIGALSGVNALMMRSGRNNVPLKEVVDNAVAMHRSDPQRIVAKGDDVEVSAKAAMAISLALHELCTNAARFGALSNEEGIVTITWSVDRPADAEPILRMAWQERAGPSVTEPSTRGFGTRLIVDSLKSDVQGRSELAFPPEGARWTLEAPLSAVVE